MIRIFVFIFASLVACASYAQSMDGMPIQRKVMMLEDRINRLEREIDRLNERIDRLQDRASDSDRRDSGSGCRASDQVKLVDKWSINVVSENLCPNDCARLLQKQQKTNPSKTYMCIRQSATFW